MAAKDKKYYWLKLKNDFFKRHDIRIIEDMENGKDFILFYIKLLAESVGHEGELRFSETIPYNEKMLATITDTDIGVAKAAIEIFTSLNLMETYDDGTIYLPEVKNMIGHETYWGEQKRIQRQKKDTNDTEIGKCPTQVQHKSNVSRQEKEIELDIDIDKEVVVPKATAAARKTLKEIIKVYEAEIGLITPTVAEEIEAFLKELPADMITRAIKEASIHNVKAWKYIASILNRCVNQGIKNSADFERKTNSPTKHKPIQKPETGKYADIYKN